MGELGGRTYVMGHRGLDQVGGGAIRAEASHFQVS